MLSPGDDKAMKIKTPPITVFNYSRPKYNKKRESKKGEATGCSGFLYSQYLRGKSRGRDRGRGRTGKR